MIEPKSTVQQTPLAHHGAFDYDELEQLHLSPDDIIDFSVNSNPYGPPPGVREILAQIPLDTYPDRECIALRRRLAAWLTDATDADERLSPQQVVVGNGTAELLMLIAQAFIRPADTALIVEPTFSEYERAARLAGASISTYRALADDNFAIDWNAIGAHIREADVRVVFICNPNNPTGTQHPLSAVRHLVQEHPDTLFVSDEAYVQFLALSPQRRATDIAENLISVRSMTKDYALAGLRLGYAFGHTRLIEAIRKVRPAWNVNALAQAAGVAVLDADSWLRDSISRLHDDKTRLIAGLQQMGYAPLKSDVHYFLMNVGDATAFRQTLLAYRLMVRDCTSFGLPAYVRIATRTRAENQQLLDAIAELSR